MLLQALENVKSDGGYKLRLSLSALSSLSLSFDLTPNALYKHKKVLSLSVLVSVHT